MTCGVAFAGDGGDPGTAMNAAGCCEPYWHCPLAFWAPRKQNRTCIEPNDTPRWSWVRTPTRYRAGGPTARSKLAVSAATPATAPRPGGLVPVVVFFPPPEPQP